MKVLLRRVRVTRADERDRTRGVRTSDKYFFFVSTTRRLSEATDKKNSSSSTPSSLLFANQICHTDLHFIAHDVGQHSYPLVPGHEIIGVVTNVGSKATDFEIGDIVGVGCMVESCLSCSACANDEEQYCKNTPTWTYGADTRHSLHGKNQVQTIGGYSDKFVVDHRFAVKFPFSEGGFRKRRRVQRGFSKVRAVTLRRDYDVFAV